MCGYVLFWMIHISELHISVWQGPLCQGLGKTSANQKDT